MTDRPGMWPLSCYGKGDEPCLLGGDTCFEELRWVTGAAASRGIDPNQVFAKTHEFIQGKETDIRAILNFPMQQLKQVLDNAREGRMAPAGAARIIDHAMLSGVPQQPMGQQPGMPGTQPGMPGMMGQQQPGSPYGAAQQQPQGAFGGGLGVAVRCILTQLQAGTRGVGEDLNGKGQRTSGRSVRHLRRWYQSVTAEGDAAGTNNTAGGGGSKAEVRGDENTAVGTDADSGKENDESRAPIDAAAAAAPAARALRERTVAVIGAAATLGTSQPGVMNAESIETPERPVTLLQRRPVVVIVEDTESFDNRVLSDLLLALSDAGDTLPVCVLLGVATSASMMHGIIPAAVAARLRVESFSLWSPKAIMTAVQENVLLDPGFVPAPSNAALELLVTRFAEHDFSLSAARRAMHLLALDHFMTRELSSLAMCMTAAMNAAAEATDALADADVDADADAADVDASIARIARLATKKKAIANAASEMALEKARAVADETLTPSSVAWAKKHLTDFQTGECWVHSSSNDADAADSIARTVVDGYTGRRRWAVALRCVAAAATTARYARDEAKLSTLLVDASSTRWLGAHTETLPPGAHAYASNKAKAAANKAASKSVNTNAISQGEKLLRLLCARLDSAVGESKEHAVTDSEVKSLALTWLELDGCDRLTDVSALESLHRLELDCCYRRVPLHRADVRHTYM